MQFSYVESKKMKTLEEYAVSLATGLISLQTLAGFHEKAIKLGILKEDMECRGNTILWDLHRMLRLYHDQLHAVLELLPPDFNVEAIINQLRKTDLALRRKKKDDSQV